jgi:hypothetical protein
MALRPEMERMMSKTTSRELTEAELNAVAGGFRITNVRGAAMGPSPSLPQTPSQPVVLVHEHPNAS